MSPGSREPIVVADAGPLIRLAAAGLLDSLRGLNRRIVLVDRVADEVYGDPGKPYADVVSDWVRSMGPAIFHAVTVTGAGIAALRGRPRTPEEDAALKAALRNSGELAVREFVDRWRPEETTGAIVLYEDRKVVSLFMESEYPVTLMTTRAFARLVGEWGVNVDAVAALEAVADRYDLKPAVVSEIDPDVPPDLRPNPTGGSRS